MGQLLFSQTSFWDSYFEMPSEITKSSRNYLILVLSTAKNECARPTFDFVFFLSGRSVLVIKITRRTPIWTYAKDLPDPNGKDATKIRYQILQ